MGVLADILHKSGRGEPEPRLIFQAGTATIQAVYHVGMYSDKEFMGSGKGHSFSPVSSHPSGVYSLFVTL